jgi:sugar (pentulose or hexulose) kinase
VRRPEATFTLANLIRAHLSGAFATLALGMRVLTDEGVRLDRMFAHGGMFRTAGVAQQLLAAALDAPVAVGATASEGGAWGIAVLADYLAHAHMPLGEYLETRVFADASTTVADPDPRDAAGFAAYLERYRRGLAVEAAAVAAL